MGAKISKTPFLRIQTILPTSAIWSIEHFKGRFAGEDGACMRRIRAAPQFFSSTNSNIESI
jgi:hypothetical protein